VFLEAYLKVSLTKNTTGKQETFEEIILCDQVRDIALFLVSEQPVATDISVTAGPPVRVSRPFGLPVIEPLFWNAHPGWNRDIRCRRLFREDMAEDMLDEVAIPALSWLGMAAEDAFEVDRVLAGANRPHSPNAARCSGLELCVTVELDIYGNQRFLQFNKDSQSYHSLIHDSLKSDRL
jgi:hypothetical protein